MSRRTKLGIAALILLITAAVLGVLERHSPLAEESFSACLRLGVVLAVFWLASPDLARFPGWLLPALIVIALAMYQWRWLIAAVPVVIAIAWLLRPRDAAKSRR